MPTTNVLILREGDESPWTDLNDDTRIHLADNVWRVAILERGMSSGKASIALRLDLPDGRSVVAETSLASFVSIMAAARGAFPAEFVGGPFARTPDADVQQRNSDIDAADEDD